MIGHKFVDNLHVSTSNIVVVRELWKRLKPEIRRDPKLRVARKVFYSYHVKRHQQNRDRGQQLP